MSRFQALSGGSMAQPPTLDPPEPVTGCVVVGAVVVAAVVVAAAVVEVVVAGVVVVVAAVVLAAVVLEVVVARVVEVAAVVVEVVVARVVEVVVARVVVVRRNLDCADALRVASDNPAAMVTANGPRRRRIPASLPAIRPARIAKMSDPNVISRGPGLVLAELRGKANQSISAIVRHLAHLFGRNQPQFDATCPGANCGGDVDRVG